MDSKEPTVVWIQSSQEKKGGVKQRKGVVPTLGARMGTGGGNIPFVASGVATTTDTPTKSTESDLAIEDTKQETLGEWTPEMSPITIFSARAFLANLSASRANGRVLRTLEELFSSRSPASLKPNSLIYYSSKTSKDFSATIRELRSRSSLNRWRSWGIGVSGRYLTADTLEFPKSGRECSLSDILEREVDEKYFLSESQTKYLLKNLAEGEESHLLLMRTTSKEQANSEHS